MPPRDDARYEELRAQVEKADLKGLSDLEHTLVEARDAGQISGEQWRAVSELVEGRAAALVADVTAEQPEPVGA